MGSKVIIRNCAYPVINEKIRDVGGQDPLKQHIKDFTKLLLDVGLVRSVLPDQLDVNNIPDLDLNVVFPNDVTVTNLYWNFDNVRAVYHKPIEFAFVDSLQAASPVKIKFEFFFFSPHRRTFVSVEENKKFRPYFGCKTTVSNGIFSQINWDILPYSATQIGTATAYNSWPIDTIQLLYTQKKSIVCYNSDTGYFYLNHCPTTRYNLDIGNSTNLIPITSCFHMCVSRSKDNNGNISSNFLRYITKKEIYSLSNSSALNASGTYNISKASNFYSRIISYNPTVALYESHEQFITPNNAATYSGNNQYFTYMSYAYNSSTKVPEYDPYVLIGNKAMSTAESNLFYDIKVNNSETKKYVCVSQDDTYGYPYNVNQVLLFYCDGIISE